MPLLRTCCCFKSVRNGSFASAIYTMAFYIILMTAGSFHIHKVYDQTEILTFTLAMVCLSAVMVITSILLIIGLCADYGPLFVPWMVAICHVITLDVLLLLYLLTNSIMDPFKAVIFAFDLFICGINVYCLLCVTSYYQQCRRDMLHLKYLAPNTNGENNFTDLTKFDCSTRLLVRNGQTFDEQNKYSLERHIAIKNSHCVDLSTITEDNEQSGSTSNAFAINGKTDMSSSSSLSPITKCNQMIITDEELSNGNKQCNNSYV